LKHGGTQLQTSRPNLLVDIAERNPFNFLCGSGWFARIQKRGVEEEFVGSYLYQVHLCRCLESDDYGRLHSGNNANIKVMRMFGGCPLYRSTSKLNGIFARFYIRGGPESQRNVNGTTASQRTTTTIRSHKYSVLESSNWPLFAAKLARNHFASSQHRPDRRHDSNQQ
jgi:hypothetical protein